MGKKTAKSMSFNKRILIFKKSRGLCWYCGCSLTMPAQSIASDTDACIDHVFPLLYGGSDDVGNLVPCCRLCNREKSTNSIETFRVIKNWRYVAKCKKFDAEQLDWLAKNGINPPIPSGYVFWFEIQGLSI